MCQHIHTITVFEGSVKRSYGEYDDNIVEQTLCLDCNHLVRLDDKSAQVTEDE